ncbi:viral Ubiquitin-like protein [Drosera capensis]
MIFQQHILQVLGLDETGLTNWARTVWAIVVLRPTHLIPNLLNAYPLINLSLLSSQSLSSIAMYIRVKRFKTTYFLSCDPTETILDIKQKLESLIDQPVDDQRLILTATGVVLEDSKTLAEQKVENDAVVALTLRKDDDQFEEINIMNPNDFLSNS